MNCPYCGQMMEHGTLCANGNIRFLPDGVKDPLFFNRDEYEDLFCSRPTGTTSACSAGGPPPPISAVTAKKCWWNFRRTDL